MRIPSNVDTGDDLQSSKKRREPVSRSCKACRLAKKKCDEQRPCSRCFQRGESDTCDEWFSDGKDTANPGEALYLLKQEYVVPPKLSYSRALMSSISSVRIGNPTAEVMSSYGWTQSVLIGIWELGFCKEDMVNL